jgi:hypothetical protein
MKKLTLSVSASFLAIAGCGGDPAPKHPEEIYTNSMARVDATASATPSASAPAQAPSLPELETNSAPRPEDFVRTTNATPPDMPVPPPPSSAKPTKPGPPKHTNSMPR